MTPLKKFLFTAENAEIAEKIVSVQLGGKETRFLIEFACDLTIRQ